MLAGPRLHMHVTSAAAENTNLLLIFFLLIKYEFMNLDKSPSSQNGSPFLFLRRSSASPVAAVPFRFQLMHGHFKVATVSSDP